MQDILLHSLVDAAAPPDWLLVEAKETLNQGAPTQALMNQWGEDFTARPLRFMGTTFKNAFNHSCFLSDKALQWARSSITHLAKDIRITFTQPGLERCGPHVDRTRDYTLMYLLKTGGQDHSTVFYREKNQEVLIRERAYHVDDYNCVERIAHVQQTTGHWNLVQARVLHSIENIQDGRISIQISIDVIDDLVYTNPLWHHADQ